MDLSDTESDLAATLEANTALSGSDRQTLADAFRGIEAHWPRIVAQQRDIAGDAAEIPAALVISHARHALAIAAGYAALDEAIARLADGTIAHQITIGHDLSGTPPEAACGAGCFFCCVLVDRISATPVEIALVHAEIADAPMPGIHPNACPALDPETRGCRAHSVRPLVCRDVYATRREPCETAYARGALGDDVTFMHSGGMLLFYGINWLLITLGSDKLLATYDLKASLHANGAHVPLP